MLWQSAALIINLCRKQIQKALLSFAACNSALPTVPSGATAWGDAARFGGTPVQPLVRVYLPSGEMGKGKCTCGHFLFALASKPAAKCQKAVTVSLPEALSTWGSVSCSVPRLGSPRQRAVMCGSPQPMLGVSMVTVGAGLEKRRPSGFTNLGKPCLVWGAGSPAAGEAQMGKASPHVLVLLLHSSLCTHSGPCWRQNLGLEGSFPHECNRGTAEDNVVKPLEGAAPCSSKPLAPTSHTPTVPAPTAPVPTAPPAQRWTFLTRCFLCHSALSGQ